MKVDLYLKKINQEMIKTGTVRVAGCDFYASWTKSCCILDFKKPSRMDPGYLIRKEDVGGLIWSPKTGAVYKLDEEAYHTLLELDHGLNDATVASRVGVKEAQVKKLRETIGKLRI